MRDQKQSRKGGSFRWGPATYEGEPFDSPSDLANFLRLQITGRRDMIDVFECTGKYKVDAVKGLRFIVAKIQRGLERPIEADNSVNNRSTKDHVYRRDKIMLEGTVTGKLIHLWMEHSEGTKAEKCQQIYERIVGLRSLEVLEVTKPIYKRLRKNWILMNYID